ncbi:hypothetical protein AB0M57_02335 [Streptomyces sp. NPDC051597]|uniref:hypothetical protein n=1 Tax=Streptomyces sp. NPDC051597 TaxID=3155049 RepID=UPI0034210A1B
MTDAGPFRIPGHVRRAVTPASQRLVLNRRGSTVWDVEGSTGRVAVKLGYPSRTHAWTALAPAREGVILRALGSDVVTYGQWDQGTWNVQPWHAGTDLHYRWEPYRTRDEVSRPPVSDALACARALAELHDKGVVHGDVQPAHFILGGEPVRAALMPAPCPVPRAPCFFFTVKGALRGVSPGPGLPGAPEQG